MKKNWGRRSGNRKQTPDPLKGELESFDQNELTIKKPEYT